MYEGGITVKHMKFFANKILFGFEAPACSWLKFIKPHYGYYTFEKFDAESTYKFGKFLMLELNTKLCKNKFFYKTGLRSQGI